MRPLTDREQIIFGICVGIVSIFITLNFAIKPLKNKSQNFDQQIGQNQRLLEKNSRLIRKADEVKAKEKYYLDILRQDGTDEETMAKTISSIEKIATQTDLHISELKPKSMKRQDNFNLFSITLTLDSSLVKILEFLDLLQKKPYYFSVDEMDLTKQMGNNSSDLHVNLTLSKILILHP
ncbi:MAG: hypothetical protein HQL26_09580 [Candidatus Omnitrophica bacterium]|nr:hypothetical protein [Candidatus Omnitrophota bacterium]